MIRVSVESEGLATPKYRVYDFLQEGDKLVGEFFVEIKGNSINPLFVCASQNKSPKASQGQQVYLIREGKLRHRVYQNVDPTDERYLQFYIEEYSRS